jgi:hypothetical protein
VCVTLGRKKGRVESERRSALSVSVLGLGLRLRVGGGWRNRPQPEKTRREGAEEQRERMHFVYLYSVLLSTGLRHNPTTYYYLRMGLTISPLIP